MDLHLPSGNLQLLPFDHVKQLRSFAPDFTSLICILQFLLQVLLLLSAECCPVPRLISLSLSLSIQPIPSCITSLPSLGKWTSIQAWISQGKILRNCLKLQFFYFAVFGFGHLKQSSLDWLTVRYSLDSCVSFQQDHLKCVIHCVTSS